MTFDMLSICDPLQYLNIPTPEQLLSQLPSAINGLLDIAGRYEGLLDTVKPPNFPPLAKVLPSVDALKQQFEASVAVFKKAREDLLGPYIGEAAADLAASIALANAVIDSVDSIDA